MTWTISDMFWGQRAVAVAAAVFMGAALGVSYSLAQPHSDASGGSWDARTDYCIGQSPSNDYLSSKEFAECLDRLMRSAVDENAMPELQEILAQRIETYPMLYAMCHTVGHKVGQYAYQKTRDAGALLRSNPSVACEYGYGHGVIDGLADTNPTPEEFKSAVDACTAYLDGTLQPQLVGGYCADGTGHAAWWSTHDLNRAVDLCEVHTLEEGKLSCIGGVVMEMYEPVGFLDRGVVFPLEEAPERLDDVCREVAQRGGDSLSRGCGRGAAYVFTRPAWEAATRLSEQQRTPSALEEVALLWAQNVKHCGLLEGVARDGCLDNSVEQIPVAVLAGPPEVREEACAGLPTDIVQRCFAAEVRLN